MSKIINFFTASTSHSSSINVKRSRDDDDSQNVNKKLNTQEKPFVDMEGIHIQIEQNKTYFYDGCVETSANDETDLLRGEPKINSDEIVNWSSWILKRSSSIGSSALNTVDYLGESLANFFGITTPKYQFEINYHHNIMQEMNAEKEDNEKNMEGWAQHPQKCIITAEPC